MANRGSSGGSWMARADDGNECPPQRPHQRWKRKTRKLLLRPIRSHEPRGADDHREAQRVLTMLRCCCSRWSDPSVHDAPKHALNTRRGRRPLVLAMLDIVGAWFVLLSTRVVRIRE